MNIIEGKFNLIVSTLNGGKTTVLANLAANAVTEEKNVIYYALDSSEDYMRKRIHSLLNNKPLSDIRPNADNKYVGLNIPKNILFASSMLDALTLEFDIDLCEGTDIVFIDTLNIFESEKGAFEEKLKKNIAYFNSLCKKRNITVVASLNILRVQTFNFKDWSKLIGGNLLFADNQYINFKIFDARSDKNLEYELANVYMRITKETDIVSNEKRHDIKPLFIKSTGFAPEVNFNFEQKYFKIKGRSYPSNPSEFWQPTIDWMSVAVKKSDSICLDIDLDYINSSSEKMVLQLIKLLAKEPKNSVIWRYDIDDEDVRDMGHDMKKISEVEFKFISNVDVNNTRYIDSDIYD